MSDQAVEVPGAMAYWEWSSPDGTDLEDRDACRRANPSLAAGADGRPWGLNEEWIYEVERATMDDDEFARERFGIFPMPEDDDVLTWPLVTEAQWKACGSDESPRQSKKPGWITLPALAVEVTTNRSHSGLTVVGPCREGGHGIEVAVHGEGVGWIVDKVVELKTSGQVGRVVIDPKGPAGSEIAPLEAAGVEVTVVTFEEFKRASADWFDAVVAGELVHRETDDLMGDEAERLLTQHVGRMDRRTVGDTWLPERKGHDVTLSVGSVLALHACRLAPVGPAPTLIF